MPDSSSLKKALASLPDLAPQMVRQLEKEGVSTVGDVVMMLPFRHEDRRRSAVRVFQAAEAAACYCVLVTKTSLRFFGKGRGRGAFEATVRHADDAGLGQQLTLRWWNMPFMSKAIAEGQELVIYGKVKEWKGRLSMDHPEYEVIDAEEGAGESAHSGRITPVYRLRGGLVQKALRTAAWCVVGDLPASFVPDLLPPPKAAGEFAGWSRSRALREVHFPETDEVLDRARRYLALEEFYLYQLGVVRRRRSAKGGGGRALVGDGSLLEPFLQSLPFALTGAQSRCVGEIQGDMRRAEPMNRLLHGDVGSGKTIVALCAMVHAVEAGVQAALMAPTQILAEQHAANARKWLEPLGLRVALLTGSKKEDGSGMELFSGQSYAGQQKPHLLIGTHALLYDRDLVHDLGLVIIDEQHKFGVTQRAKLIEQGKRAHVLVMTATPIPRTLTLTLYGDLDVSTIDERPQVGVGIKTRIHSQKQMKAAVKFLREQLEAGRQGYLVYPLIEESEKRDAAAAVKGQEEWSEWLAPFQVGLLHGKMSAEEKESVMLRFRKGVFDALVSTTVIEVGVDVPNATVMMIHHADGFGLAQLHQLRGRVGRGVHQSYCVLFVDEKDEENQARLKILEETQDGFRIAEEDLRQRGPGNILGQAQSGQAPLRFAELLADTRLVHLARKLAERTLDQDPKLSLPEHELLRSYAAEPAEIQYSMRQ
jgi:ATP-dependent DNA helicase RecG